MTSREGGAGEDGTFRILHVCTGNICRSPMAEFLTRAGLIHRLGPSAGAFAVESAGTWGHTGEPMERAALTTLAGYGTDGSGFRARELMADHVTAADLILTATREHRAAAVTLYPRAAARTFTLHEFARLTSLVEPEDLPSAGPVVRARALVRAAAANRGRIPPRRPADDDLSDPYQAPPSVFETCAAIVGAAIERPLDLIAGRRPEPAEPGVGLRPPD